MRRQVVDTLAAKLTARGLDPLRLFAGPKGYVLVLGPVTVATRRAGEEILRKGRKNGAPD